MRDLLLWFFGAKNPYSPVPSRGPSWYPDILTPRWWRWCLRHPRLAPERIRLYYVRRIKYNVLRLPICWALGHNSYDTADWSWHGRSCSRCHKTLEYHSHHTRG